MIFAALNTIGKASAFRMSQRQPVPCLSVGTMHITGLNQLRPPQACMAVLADDDMVGLGEGEAARTISDPLGHRATAADERQGVLRLMRPSSL
jgi:hypothetical protein